MGQNNSADGESMVGSRTRDGSDAPAMDQRGEEEGRPAGGTEAMSDDLRMSALEARLSVVEKNLAQVATARCAKKEYHLRITFNRSRDHEEHWQVQRLEDGHAVYPSAVMLAGMLGVREPGTYIVTVGIANEAEARP